MSPETLPDWAVAIYYSFFLLTLGAAVFSLIRKRLKRLSIITLVVAITLPIVYILGGIGRPNGLNEIELLFSQLQQGSFWAIYVVINFLYLLVWWLTFLSNNKKYSNLFK